MPNYADAVNRLRLAELEVRATNFADRYRNDRNSVILVPGGMGSRLLQSTSVFQEAIDFSGTIQFREIWLSFAAIFQGDLINLRMTKSGEDEDRKPIIASGELSSFIKEYDGLEEFMSTRANYASFGYDWRKMLNGEFMYLKEFLQRIRHKVKARGFDNPLRRLTLLGHSMGGLIIKLFINDLILKRENPKDWFYRFVSVGTPFYGTFSHMSRYYVGDTLPNLVIKGGAAAVADLTASLPGPYVLLPAPKTVLVPRLDQLGLNRYPVRDHHDGSQPVDPFDGSTSVAMRYPDSMIRPYFTTAANIYKEIDKDLPDVRDQIFHIRSNNSKNDFPLEIFWKNVDGANFDPKSETPVSDNEGASDGTVPFWSARLASTSADHIYDIRNGTHGSLAENPKTLELVEQLMTENPLPVAGLQPEVPDVAVADTSDVVDLINSVKAGNQDASAIARAPAPVRRRLAYGLGLG